MLRQAENVDRRAILIEIPAHAGEGSGAVLQSVRADADIRLGEGHDLSLEKGVFEDLCVHGKPLGTIPSAVCDGVEGADRTLSRIVPYGKLGTNQDLAVMR